MAIIDTSQRRLSMRILKDKVFASLSGCFSSGMPGRLPCKEELTRNEPRARDRVKRR